MATRTRKTIRGTVFEFTRFTPAEGRPYYRVAIQDPASPVGFFGYIDQFPTKAKAEAFATNLAVSYALAG